MHKSAGRVGSVYPLVYISGPARNLGLFASTLLPPNLAASQLLPRFLNLGPHTIGRNPVACHDQGRDRIIQQFIDRWFEITTIEHDQCPDGVKIWQGFQISMTVQLRRFEG